MNIFDINEFIEQANTTPLLKGYWQVCGNITRKTLKEANFEKELYRDADLIELTKLLSGFEPPKESGIQNAKPKNKCHAELIKRYDAQKLILDLRKRMEMPPKGFKTKKEFQKWENGFAKNFAIILYSGDLTKLRGKELQKSIVSGKGIRRNEIISQYIDQILEKWRLQERHGSAIRELLLFNRLVPAESGLSINFYEKSWGSTPRLDLSGLNKDTTKEEISEFLRKCKTKLKELQKNLPGKTRHKPRKTKETQNMVDFYNSQKGTGRKDKDIFKDLARKYVKSESAIRKRILGK